MKTISKLRNEFKPFGYGINCNVICPITGRKWRYETFPLVSGGYGHFNDKHELITYLEEMKRNRGYQSDI